MIKTYTNLTLSLLRACCFVAGLFFITSVNGQCNDPSACNNGDPNNACTYPGCTNPLSCNYNSSAGCDDGSCQLFTCTDVSACNYGDCANPCYYPGCTNSTSCNYNPSAGCDDGSCYGTAGCTSPGNCNYDPSATCDNGTCNGGTPGCTNSSACNYNSSATCDDGSCFGTAGCTSNSSACNYCASCTCDNGSCLGSSGCNDPSACNYNASANCNDGSCVYPGCTDGSACNYNSSAGCDNGSCTYPGCMDPSANNYNPTAGCSATCTYGSEISAYISGSSNESCPNAGDGSITVQVSSGGDGANNFYISAYNSDGNWYTSGNSNGSTSITVNVPGGYYYYVNVYDANNPNDGYSTQISWYSYINDNNVACGSEISAYISGSSNESCPNAGDGSITVQVSSGGDGSNNFYISAYNSDGTWYTSGNSNGSTSISVNVPAGYYYYVNVYDANNPNDGFSTEVSWYSYIYDNNPVCGSEISAYISGSSNESCPNAGDGSITVQVSSGGDGSNNFYISAYNSDGTWYTSGNSNGSTSISVSVPAGYYYYVNVYDANNPNDGFSTEVSWYSYINDNNSVCGSGISAYISGSSNESCPGAGDGSITVQVGSGGDGSNNFYISAYNSDGNWYTSGNSNGSTSISVNVPAGYYYYVNVYDANNPNDGFSTEVSWYSYINDNNSVCGSGISAYISGSSNESCPGAGDGSITVQVSSGGDGSNNFYISAYNSDGNWYTSGNSNGSTSISVNVPAGYYYYVNVYDANNPNDGFSTEVSWYSYIYDNNSVCGSGISAYISGSSNESCPGAGDGSITVQVSSGGDGSNNFYISAYNSDGNWYTSGNSNGSTSISVNVPAGYYYYVNVYDANNPNDGFSTEVSWYSYINDNNSVCGSSISISFSSATNASCTSSNDGSVTLYVSGGDGSTYYVAQAYDESNGQTYSSSPTNGNYITISGMQYGYYEYYYVYDYNNPSDGWANYDYIYTYPFSYNSGTCGSTISAYVSSSANENCPGSNDGSITLSVSGGDGNNYYYAVAYDNGSTSYTSSNQTGPNITISGLTAGEYYPIYVYDADNSNDGWSYSFYPYTTISDNYPNCGSSCSPYPIPSNATVYTSDASPGCLPNGVGWVCAGVTINTLSGCGSQTFYLEPGAVVNNGGGGSNTIYERAGAIYNGLGGGDNILYTDPTATYSNNGGTPETTTVCTGLTYDYSSAPSGGCNTTPGQIQISPSETDATCNNSNGSIMISATNGDGSDYYYFTISGPASNSAYAYGDTTFTGLPAGTYTINVYDASNQSDGYSNSTTITINSSGSFGDNGTYASPTLATGIGALPCVGSSPDYGIASPNYPGGYSYQWSTSDIPANNTLSSPTCSCGTSVTWQTAGQQYVYVTVADDNGCTALGTEPVTVGGGVTPALTPTGPACTNSTATYTTTQGFSTYTWSSGGNISLTNSSSYQQTVTYGSAGAGDVYLTVTDAIGCTDTASHAVTINAPASGLISDPGAACSNSTPYSYTVATGGSNYVWSLPGGSSNTGIITAGQGTDDASITWATANTTGAGTGYVEVSFTDANGCTVDAGAQTIEINEVPVSKPNINNSPTTACADSTETFNSESGFTSYNWQVTGGVITAGGAAGDNYATITWDTAGTGTISVSHDNGNGCTGITGSVNVTITECTEVGVNNLNNINRIIVWSSDDIVNVDFTQVQNVQANIEIYNILGQKLSEDKYTASAVYHKEIPNIEEGYIIINIRNNDEIITKKLFISSLK